MLTLSGWAMFFHWQSPMQQLHFYTGTSNTRMPPPHPRHPLNTVSGRSCLNLSQILDPLLKSLTHTPVPLRVKAAAPLPHEPKGPQHLCPAPLLSCPIWSLSGLLPGHIGYLASPPTLQNLSANLARGPAPLSALTTLPSLATEVTQQPSS